MASNKYIFTKEVIKFNLDWYIPHLGWMSSHLNPLKIYSSGSSVSFFLHDEMEDRLYEFIAEDPCLLISKEEYEKVKQTFLATYPHGENV